MNIFKYIAICVLSMLAISSCKQNDIGGGELGTVQFGVATDPRADMYSVSTRSVESDPVYRLTIYKSKTQVGFYEDYTKIEKLTLGAGKYIFVVEGGQDNPVAIDEPYFKGEEEVNVVAGQTVEVSIVAKLANVRLSATVSQIIKDNFKDYSFTVRGVELTKTMIEQGKSLFISASVPEFTWAIYLKNNQDVESAFSKEITDVVPRSHYKFAFDIDNTAGLEDGSAVLNLEVDNSVDLIESDIDISLEKKELPSFKYDNPNLVFGEQSVVNEVTRGANFKVAIKSVAGLKELKLRHSSIALDAVGIPRLFKPNSMDLGQAEDVNRKGITWSALGGTVTSWIDFSALANTAPLGVYTLYVTVVDAENQSVDCVVDFVVLPDQNHITKAAQYGAKYAVLNGEWCTITKPAGMTFQYRAENAADWITVSSQSVTDGKGKNFSARIVDLTPLTKYVYRTYSADETLEDEKELGQQMDFTTFDAPEIPNLKFDEGYWGGNNWFFNATGGNSYWASGNEGVTQSIVGMSANNIGTDDAVSGKACRLTSVPITMSLSPVKFAAGSIFTGTYSTDMGNPANSPKFGRPYKGRPMALKGWFKYKPVNINNDKDGVAGDQWGKLDKCHIYISLEDWAGSSSRPGSPRIIGYGEFKTDRTVTAYEEFYIPIEYRDPSRIPTHVVLAITASHLGGAFCGGNGSELFVDEFELVWQ